MIAQNRFGLLLSVQRTGTRFTQRILQEVDLKMAQLHAVETCRDRIEVWMQKCCDEQLPIIVPLRHPLSVAKSWRSRNEKFEDMFEQWRLLTEFCSRCDPYYLPVDHDERNDFLADLAEATNLPIETTWKAYGHRPGAAETVLEPAEVNQINELIASEFVSAFYTEDVPHGTTG